jgi:hypothetical protein
VSFGGIKMIILIKLRKITVLLMIIVFLIVSGCGIYLWNHSIKSSAAFVDDSLKEMLSHEVQQMFDDRNKAILEENIDILETLYDKKLRNGLWAYEHELKKMKYLHKWSDKQGVEFKKINSEVIVRSAKKKGDGFTLGLLVSTEYQYVYDNDAKTVNSFRIGTYHTLDLIPQEEHFIITKEWYADPFADSLHLDEIKSQEIKEHILSIQPTALSALNERRISAVQYVDQYCGAASLPEYGFQYNGKYRNYNPQGGDCANFASQMLFEGASFPKNHTWNYTKGEGSKAWLNAHAFNNYMTHSGRASVIAQGSYDKVFKSSYKLLPGDYMAYEKNGKVVHISVVTGIDSKGYVLVNSHNSDRYRVPWDLGWSDKSIKFRLVRVHY